MTKQKIRAVVLGATGSIGTQALEIVREMRDSEGAEVEFEVVGLAAGSNVELLERQAAEFGVAAENAVVAQRDGFEAVITLAARAGELGADVVLNGITGSIGLQPTLAVLGGLSAGLGAGSLASGSIDPPRTQHDLQPPLSATDVQKNSARNAPPKRPRLALANKESLVSGGVLVQQLLACRARDAQVQAEERSGRILVQHLAARSHGADGQRGSEPHGGQTHDGKPQWKPTAEASPLADTITPVDSEHSAIWQALRSGEHSEIEKLILTASGGPFRGKTKSELQGVTAEQALKHPNWSMGPVVTVNSATLMNKALELIEAVYLFGVAPEDVQVVVHPQSAVHSGVQFRDGAVILQASPPDMKLPILLGLTGRARLQATEKLIPRFNWRDQMSWQFEPLDDEVFPAVNLARECLRRGPLYPTVLNAANETAVDLFLKGELAFLDILPTVETKLEAFNPESFGSNPNNPTLKEILEAQEWARKI